MTLRGKTPRSFPRKRESSSFGQSLGPRFRGDERRRELILSRMFPEQHS
jgi:hypothetical protein